MSPLSVKAMMADSMGRVLFLRNPRGELELPGGRPEPGESMEEAVVREVMEECGFIITGAVYLTSGTCTIVPGKKVLLVVFKCTYQGSVISLGDEHSEYQWVDAVGSRPNDVPPYYWSFISQANEEESVADASREPRFDMEYPLPTGEVDRQRLLITADLYDAGTKAFLQAYLPVTGGRILEVGSGHGAISRWMARMLPGAKVLGIDSSPQQVNLAIREAKELGIQNLCYLVEDLRRVEEWSFVDPEFDLITCRFTLLHLSERDRIISGLLSRLSASGVLVVEEPALDSLFCTPDVPAFTRTNSSIREYGQRNGLDYDCIAELWRIATRTECTVRDVRFSQPTVRSRAHKELVLLSFLDFKPRLLAQSIIDLAEAEEIEASLRRDYMHDRVISTGLRTLQIALSKVVA